MYNKKKGIIQLIPINPYCEHRGPGANRGRYGAEGGEYGLYMLYICVFLFPGTCFFEIFDPPEAR